MKKGTSQVIAILLMVVIAFICGFGGSVAGSWAVQNGYLNKYLGIEEQAPLLTAQPETSDNAGSSEGVTISVSGEMTVAEAIAEKVLPSVVGISTTYSYTSSYGNFFGWGGNAESYEATSIGTGFIVDKSGYILTNSHVVNDGDFKSITVSLYDGETADATVLYNSVTLDLAVLKIDAEGRKLVAADLGDSDGINIGSYAAVIGNPLGLAFERSMSQGIISGLNRTLTATNESTGSSTTMEGLIQTDATINSGNSGGPLLNSQGLVIGISTAKAANGEGMGFAIPINVAKPIVQQIIGTGSYSRPLIGITGIGLEDQTSYSKKQLEEYFGTTTGIYVYSLTEGGGAEAAGLEKGDIITEMEGTAVNTMNRLNTLLVQYDPGDTITLTVLRGGREMYIELTLTGEKSGALIAPAAEEGGDDGSAPEDLDEGSDQSPDGGGGFPGWLQLP